MPKRKRRPQGLIAPTTLPSFDAVDPDLLVVVIETPKGSRNKYAFDSRARIFSLTKVLPAGMEFPYDFGFVPSTKAEDGDPLDALVLMDEPAFPGCRLTCRPIGVIEGVEEGKKSTERNDRVVCVEQGAHSFTHIKHIDALCDAFEEELEDFFVSGSRARWIAPVTRAVVVFTRGYFTALIWQQLSGLYAGSWGALFENSPNFFRY